MKGIVEMGARMTSVARRFPATVATAIYDECGIELAESNRRIPVKTGRARSTGKVSEPVIEGRKIRCTISYGADDPVVQAYIVPLHENTEAIHPNGEAKFLESTLNESRSTMRARIAARIEFDKTGD